MDPQQRLSSRGGLGSVGGCRNTAAAYSRNADRRLRRPDRLRLHAHAVGAAAAGGSRRLHPDRQRGELRRRAVGVLPRRPRTRAWSSTRRARRRWWRSTWPARACARRESDTALVGGTNLMLSPGTSIACSRWGMLSPDGQCKTFDAGADGYVRSEGCGVVVLKRLADAQRDGDRVLAVVPRFGGQPGRRQQRRDRPQRAGPAGACCAKR